jgi:simple sugar transport system permease protein
VVATLWRGSVGTDVKRADTVVVWVSLAICSAGLLITFRAGQWNIGVEGQIVLGAVFAYWAARGLWEAPAGLAIPVMLLWGAVGGAFWATLVGVLKVFGGVNEIFGGLGLNFVSTSLTIYLIAGPWKKQGTSAISNTELLPRDLWMPTMEGLRISLYTVAVAFVVLTVVYLALRGTVWGLQLKAVGRSMRGAFVLGVPTRRVLFTAYAAGGACAGLVGAILIVAVRHQLAAGVSSGYGFLSILIVLLSAGSVLAVAPIALFFAALGIGGVALQLGLGMDSSLSGVLVGVIVLSYELVQGVRQKVRERRRLAPPPVPEAVTVEQGS